MKTKLYSTKKKPNREGHITPRDILPDEKNPTIITTKNKPIINPNKIILL
jgi:hypothetical protein